MTDTGLLCKPVSVMTAYSEMISGGQKRTGLQPQQYQESTAFGPYGKTSNTAVTALLDVLVTPFRAIEVPNLKPKRKRTGETALVKKT